jgi:hypothetical protein
VLVLDPDHDKSLHTGRLRETGFIVHTAPEWPADDHALREYHVVVVRVRQAGAAPMIAARLRAKPHFGRRLMIALVDPDTPRQARRIALAGGFDDVVNVCSEPRQLMARILRGLRARPELRCMLPPLQTRPSAA